MKKITAIIASIAAILCIGGIVAYTYMNSNQFLINKYIETCSIEAPNSPDYCKCMAYFDHEFNKDIFKGLAHADRIAQKAILQALSKEKYELYQDKIKYCRQFLSDENYLASLDYTLQNSEICAREAFYKLPENTRWYLKSENTDAEKLEIKRNFFANLTKECMDNLDSEDEGQLFIGCAGGEHTDAWFHYEKERVKSGGKLIRLAIEGGIGGHSGDDINKHRANTVKLLADFLAGEISSDLQILSFVGGGKSNAIARECSAVVATADSLGVAGRFGAYGNMIKAEYSETEPGLVFSADEVKGRGKAIDAGTAAALVSALSECPHGVQKMSPDIEGLVQTSSNLAAVSMPEDGIVKVSTSQRSSVEAELDEVVEGVAEVFRKAGASVDCYNKYPGWKPNLKSHILQVCVKSYRKLFNQQPLVLAIHAGLECGLFLEKFPDLDMISFGPTLRGVHAPGEKLELSSLDRFVKLLDDVVCNFK